MRRSRKISGLAAALIAVAGMFIFAQFRASKSPYLEGIAEVSLFMAASIATHFLYFMLEKEEHLRDIRSAISETESRILDGVVAASNRLGLAGFEERLDYGKLLAGLEKEDELLWLDTFAQSYTVFMSKLKPALERGCTIRMLVINPECDNAGYRAAEIGDGLFADPEAFRDQVADFINTIERVAAQAGKSSGPIEVRTYSDLPCVPLYIVRRAGLPVRGYSSFFFHQATDGYFHMSWRYAQSGFLAEASEYFDKKWEANKSNIVLAGKFKRPHTGSVHEPDGIGRAGLPANTAAQSDG